MLFVNFAVVWMSPTINATAAPEAVSLNVPAFAWEKQILHVLAYSDSHATYVQQAYEYFESTEPEVLGDTIVILTTTDGDDDFIYYSCPL